MINKKVYAGYDELSIETARLIAQVIEQKPGALLCFPSGETSVGTFRELVKLKSEGKLSFSQCKIVGLDEWINLGTMKSENCFHFLKKHLFDLVDLNWENICFFDGEARDLHHECQQTDEFIMNNGGIDLMLLGVGMNGHIGLNEPGTPISNYSHIVELDSVTKSVAQKYFSSAINLSRGITLGMKHVMETKTVILQASGQKKSTIVKHMLEAEPSIDFPASLLKLHPNAFLLLDKEAAEV